MTLANLNPATSATTSQVSFLRLLVATAVAVVLNLAALVLGGLSGATWQTSAPESINALTVAVTTVVPLLGAGSVTWLIGCQRPGLVRWAAWGGLIFGLALLPMPFVASDDLATAVSLASMHVITTVAWFLAVRPAPTAGRA